MGNDVYERDSSGYDRALGFFDAIYGFSLTLLIANLDVPPPEAWQSIDTLLAHEVGSQLTGFLISFIVIAVFWRVNHGTIDRLSRIDSRVITVNIIAAGLIIFIPFSTQGMSDPATADYALPTSLYAVNIAAAMVAQSAIVFVARRSEDGADLSRRQWMLWILDAMVGPVVFFASVPVAYVWGGNDAKFVWLALIVLGPLSARLTRAASPASDTASS
ncbi:TMEM175 family protein [Paramicrobacterium agarici]|uniref:TMEM175 family protein n=1 Tax=Paramicrobacterium agarici TaxID=630514 RepID=UPI00115476F1|nr:TMEM175 family protein [Microbacterium agarici]TQO23473.1 uncharacterized protein DUF1211 [Microbacterium agarici]